MYLRNYITGLAIFLLTALLVNISFLRQEQITIDYDTRADSLFTLALELIGKAELEEAEEDLRKAIAIQPSYAPYHYFLGEIYSKERKTLEAVSEFSKAIALDPELYPAFYRLGIIFSETGKKSDAIVYLRRAVALNPYYLDAYLELREIFIAIGDYKSAEEVDILLDKLSSQFSE